MRTARAFCRRTRAARRLATRGVAWYNTHRLLEPLGYLPPAEYEAQYQEQVSRELAALALK